MSERDPGHAAGVLLVCAVAGSIAGYATDMGKLMVVFAIGYVLGAEAGRERYDQIRRAFSRVLADPRVHDVVLKVEDRVMNHYNESQHSGDGVSPNRSESAW